MNKEIKSPISFRVMKWCKNNILTTLIIVVLVLNVVAILFWFSGDWFFAGSVETFGPLSSYILIWLSIVVASIAACGTTLAFSTSYDSFNITKESLDVTKKALELTRAMTRPFLSYQTGDALMIKTDNEIIAKYSITNSGSLPASEVDYDITFFDIDENITEDNQSIKYPIPNECYQVSGQYSCTTIFPNCSTHLTAQLDLKDKVYMGLNPNIDNGKVKLRLRIFYKFESNNYKTIHTEYIHKVDADGKRERTSIPPQTFT